MRTTLILLALAACKGGVETGESAAPTTDTDTEPATTDTDPGAVCGDGEVEGAEACDDGNDVGGDGCTPTCTAESGTLEAEPDDTYADATALTAPATAHGRLWAGDRDCWSVEVPDAGAVRATGSRDGGCDPALILELVDADDARVVAGLPATDGCGAIDPDTDTFARYLPAGTYAVCAEAAYGEPLDVYQLDVDVVDACTDLPPLTPDASQDRDLDGVADVCDPDDDNDGVDDAVDNCPDTPNGVGMDYAFTTADDGRVRQWLVLAPFTSGATPGGCEPSVDALADPAGVDDATVAPVLGDQVGDLWWVAHLADPTAGSTLDFLQYASATEPREGYAATWFELPDSGDLELTLGTDDGHRVWVDGAEVGVQAGCQGVYEDQFIYPLTLDAGWHRVVVKVYDGGGGWGVTARLREPDGAPITTANVSLAGPTPWVDDQGDQDGDGIGDVCDPTPGAAG